MSPATILVSVIVGLFLAIAIGVFLGKKYEKWQKKTYVLTKASELACIAAYPHTKEAITQSLRLVENWLKKEKEGRFGDTYRNALQRIQDYDDALNQALEIYTMYDSAPESEKEAIGELLVVAFQKMINKHLEAQFAFSLARCISEKPDGLPPDLERCHL